MKIVFVVDHYNSITDGTVISARRFEKELIAQGHTVVVVSYGVQGENKYALKENRIPIVSPVSKKFNLTYAKFDRAVMTEAFTGADVVHLFLPFSAERKSRRLAQKMGIAVTAAFHVHPNNILKNMGIKKPPRFLTSLLFWLWRVTFYNKIRHVHCPSAFTAEALKQHKYTSELHVISNGVAPEFVPAEKPAYTADRNFEILMVGRFAAEKRQDLLIKAVAASAYRDKINITFAGGGPLEGKYVDLARRLPNSPVFAFLPQERLLKQIRASDLYIHAADVEIEGISCIEAFASGLVPVIGNAPLSAARQFVLDERCSFEAGNAESLRARIEYWIEHPGELQKMGSVYAEYAKSFALEKSVAAAVGMFACGIKNTADAKSGRDAPLKSIEEI